MHITRKQIHYSMSTKSQYCVEQTGPKLELNSLKNKMLLE